MALASCEQRLRATESERQLLVAQVERLELGVRRAAESHNSALSAEAERREQELGSIRSEREEQVGSLRRRLAEMAEQLDGARADLRELLTERSQALQQAEAAQRHALEKAGEAEAATRSLAASERALADLREERQQALALRDERIRELTAQVADLGRAGDSRSAEHQAALGTWMNAYNALRGAADKQRGELLALQSSERRTSDTLQDTERRLRDAQEAAVVLRLELQRQTAHATAAEMEAKLRCPCKPLQRPTPALYKHWEQAAARLWSRSHMAKPQAIMLQILLTAGCLSRKLHQHPSSQQVWAVGISQGRLFRQQA
ncbi:hypothetical protein HXX76_002936 [Chlamydomonas incerta]|uniref:Uncharacterized protein n=1 Tax=Chlamydomonas incerta TaxID=51695 RepID=A0A835W6Z2_CHLIN|nr:hypothetical protein HXX76_002936 [Chlamydomonas incerta]|eukprot:KAG2442857.1 hypothetical protein HXX76_002936 [Chlamydomonas incerta]